MYDPSFREGGFDQVNLCDLPVGNDLLMGLLDRPAVADDLIRANADLLSTDPVFCSCAAWAASAEAFGSGSAVSPTLESLVRRLGHRGVTALAARRAILQQSPRDPLQDPGVLRELRFRGALRGRIGLALAALSGYARPEEARFATMLLDLGRIALFALGDTRHGSAPAGPNEAKIGARLLESWGYGPLLSDAMRYQHEQPHLLADAHPLVRIAHAARRLSDAWPSQLEQACKEVTEVIGSDPEEIRGLMEKASTILSESGTWEDPNTQVLSTDAADTQLASVVSRRALLGEMSAYWAVAENQMELLHAVAQVLAIFFGIRNTLYLQREGDVLRGIDLFGGGNAIGEIRVRVHAEGGLIARAVANADVLYSLHRDQSALTVVDKEVIRLLERRGMLCLPMAVGGESAGIFLAGLHPARLDWLGEHWALLRNFTAQAGAALRTVRRQQAKTDWSRQEVLSECNLRARRTAHEVSTPLTIINNCVSIIETKLDQGKSVEEDLAVIAGELARAERIILEFREGFKDYTDARGIALNAMVRDLAAILKDTLIKGRDISLTLSLDEGMPATLDFDGKAVRQVLINLARNAIEAMNKGGRLELATEDHVRFEHDDHVAVSVSDTGPGLPAHRLASLFEPVHSSKGGTHQGLGLSIVRDILDRLGARIMCRSREGAGTTFTVLLPRKT